MAADIFSQGLRNSFTQNGMRVFLIKADKEDDIYEEYESLRSRFSTLPHTGFQMLKSNAADSQPPMAVVILSSHSFCATSSLFNEARSMALSGLGNEIIDLRQPATAQPAPMMGA